MARFACPKFLKQSFVEFARCSVGSSVWAREYFDQQRAKGVGRHAIYRALAYKWIRILFRCWKDRTPYDEQRYLTARQLRKKSDQSSTKQKAHRQTKDLLDIEWKSCGDFWKLGMA